jgi:hypothetical protein
VVPHPDNEDLSVTTEAFEVAGDVDVVIEPQRNIAEIAEGQQRGGGGNRGGSRPPQNSSNRGGGSRPAQKSSTRSGGNYHP